MIRKNAQFGTIRVQSLAEFGKGDIQVIDAKGDNYAAVLFRNDIPHKIGDTDPSTAGITTDQFKPEIVLLFDNIESIDVVIEAFLNARNTLIMKSLIDVRDKL